MRKTVTVIQRFGSSLNLNVHSHTLALDGVFTETPPGQLTFRPAASPVDEEVATVLATARRLVRRLLARRGLEPGDDGARPADPLADLSPTLAGLGAASVQGRGALGAQAGGRVRRVAQAVQLTPRPAPGPRQAHLHGFDLHADARLPARDRARLERVCRDLLRPPLAQERVRLRPDGRVRVELKAPGHGGNHARPAINLLVDHGVLAPDAPARRQAVGYGRPAPDTPGPAPAESGADRAGAAVPRPPRHGAWAALLPPSVRAGCPGV